MVRPMSRKDIFYSGSVTNLQEYKSQKSLSNYRQSVVSLTKFEKDHRHDRKDSDMENGGKYFDNILVFQKFKILFMFLGCDPCPCINLPPSFKSAISSMMDVSLLKDPAFMLIAISNLFGMAGLYVPFVYLVDVAVSDGIEPSYASFLISIIGITNTVGRIVCGYVADFPWVDALFLNNICLVISTVAVAATPFCSSYASYVAVAFFFGIAICEFFRFSFDKYRVIY